MVIDIGAPGRNLGWAIDAPDADGQDLDAGIEELASSLVVGPVALGFEAPQFVPMRDKLDKLTAARPGETGPGLPSRPFSASAGSTVLVTSLVVVPYVLRRLRDVLPTARATLDWKQPLGPGDLLLFEAFVTNQRKTADTRHVEDARLAIAEFKRREAAQSLTTSVTADPCLSLLGAALLRTGWTADIAVLATASLVIRTTD